MHPHRDVEGITYVAQLDPGVATEHGFGSGRGGYFYLEYLSEGVAEVNSMEHELLVENIVRMPESDSLKGR